jgi:hypothetical protein
MWTSVSPCLERADSKRRLLQKAGDVEKVCLIEAVDVVLRAGAYTRPLVGSTYVLSVG